MRKFYFSLILFFSSTFLLAQSTASFEEFQLPLDTFLNNAESAGGYQSGDAFFPNEYNPDFGGFWESGWAISTMRDDSTSGFGNLYSAITGSGSGVGGSGVGAFAVGQQSAMIHIQNESMGKVIEGLYLTNTTYAHNSMRDGDDFAKKFGGESGADPDFFKIEIRKFYKGNLDTNAVEFYLADFRFEADSLDYIVSDWQWVDLSNLGNVDSLQFTLVSTDIGEFGINTPLFFCIDNLEISEEISTSNQEELLAIDKIAFYPNPTINEIIIDLTNIQSAGELQIFDLLGRSLIHQVIGSTQNSINVSSLKTGTYILQVVAEDGKRFSNTFMKY